MSQSKTLKELRALSSTELEQRASDQRNALADLRLRIRQGAMKQTHKVSQIRREIARILTLLRETSPQKGKGHAR